MVSCRRCGQPLSNPTSIARGMGPVCARKADIPLRRSSSSSSSSPSISGSPSLDVSDSTKESAKTVAKGASVGAVVATNPELAPLYKAYTAGKAGKKIYDTYQNHSDTSEKFSNAVEESAKQGIAFQTSNLSENEAEEIAEDFKSVIEKGDGFERIAESTDTAEYKDVYGEMLKGSTKYALTEGAGELSKNTFEVAF